MGEQVAAYQKTQSATTPETWGRVGEYRRARIELLSEVAGMNETVRWDFGRQVTHHAYVEIREGLPLSDFEAEHGSRMLYSRTRNQQYVILRAVPWGDQLGQGRYRWGRLSLSMTDTDILGQGTPNRD